NGPDCTMLGNKIMLANLSAAADENALDAEDARWLGSKLPWTRQVRAAKVVRHGSKQWLPDLLVSAKDELVLKPGEGFGSDQVKIGRNLSASDWEHAVADALERGTWVVQDVIGGAPIWLLGSNDEMRPHSVNLAVILCGDEYAGAFLRLLPVA